MMKKSIFAVAVASVLTLGAAQAETILYGSIRYDYENKKNETAEIDQKNGHVKFSGKSLSNLEDAGSRIGIKGSEDLGNNNAVIYNIEYGFDGMSANEKQGFKVRKAILGLTGDWGTFTAGRQDNPFKVTIVDDTIVDEFNASNVIKSASQRAMTTTLNGTGIASVSGTVDNYKFNDTTINNAEYSRVGKVIAYTTPDFAGFSANVALMMDSDLYKANNEKNLDLWTINAKYDYDFGADGTLTAKAGYLEGKMGNGALDEKGNVGPKGYNKGKSKVWGLFLGYNQDAFGVTATYANGNYKSKFKDATTGPKHKSEGWDIGARYSFGANYFSTVRATYGQNTVKVNGEAGKDHGKDKVKSWAVGFEQKLSTRTRAWVEYGNEETTYAADNVGKKKDNVISVGMRHDF
ncbi:porin [Ignatzschineria sp. LJL83]